MVEKFEKYLINGRSGLMLMWWMIGIVVKDPSKCLMWLESGIAENIN